MDPVKDLTVMLRQAQEGNREVVDRIFSAVYQELHGLAKAQRLKWDGNHTMNTTVLVHEAYLKLVDQQRAEWKDRSHFFAVAALAMRHILVNYARRAKAARRGGGSEPMSLGEGIIMEAGVADEILALNESLDQLALRNTRQARIVELRFFVGLSVEEAAEALDISPATVKRDWQLASTWLRKEIQKDRS
jgi:RNA polymerase sigma factor (TIGR02999 family)